VSLALEWRLQMQTLGLSESTPRTESRLKALFWPVIRSDVDFDYITTQGFWICFIVAIGTPIFSAVAGFPVAGAFEGAFYFFAGLGVRQRSRVAAITAFAAYLLGALANGFSVPRVIFLALLFANIRGNWLSARWERDQQVAPQPRLSETLGDKLSDQLPAFLWPKVRILFYLLAALEIGLSLLGLAALALGLNRQA